MTATAHDGARPGEPLACLEIPYDLRFTDTVQAWLAGLVGLAGGSRRETASLHLALDETLTFLINAYPDAEPWERMRLAFALPEDGLAEVAVSNAGPPVHLDRIPRYDPQSPAEADLNGLWYFLASEASDELVFENRGMEGWRAVIRKRLAEPAFAPRPPAKTAETGPAHQIVFTTRQAVPEDAAELVDLTYDTYRYSYPVEEFYHEDQLRQALARGEISSFVVEADGRIVGNSTFIISPGTPRCAYSCSLMVRRAFRQSRAIMHLIKAVEQALAEASLDVDLYYGTMVTTHTGSQKAGARVGFHPLCLLLAVGAPVDYRGMRVATSERESFLLCLRLAVPPALSTLYLPERHHVVMAALLGQIGFTGALSCGRGRAGGGDVRPPGARGRDRGQRHRDGHPPGPGLGGAPPAQDLRAQGQGHPDRRHPDSRLAARTAPARRQSGAVERRVERPQARVRPGILSGLLRPVRADGF